tara:strand:+ start:1427 stop:1696 length:270 start_codon:yes stop_codon:yes gene_type:complete
MNITISHTINHVDAADTIPESQHDEVMDSLESAYAKALSKDFPGADIEFWRINDTYSVKIDDVDDPLGHIAEEVGETLASVWDRQDFWI